MSEIINSILSGKALEQGSVARRPKNLLSSDNHAPEKEPSISKKGKKDLWRLNSALANDQPLKDNVPRGYYLNILV